MDNIQIWFMKKQRRYNLILAMATLVLAVTGLLQLIKLYDYYIPNWVYIVLVVGGLILPLFLVILELIDEYKGD